MATRDELEAAVAAQDYEETKRLLELKGNPNEYLNYPPCKFLQVHNGETVTDDNFAENFILEFLGNRAKNIMHFSLAQSWRCPNTLLKFERLLLEHGADPNIQSQSGHVPLVSLLRIHETARFGECSCQWILGNEDKCPARKPEAAEMDAGRLRRLNYVPPTQRYSLTGKNKNVEKTDAIMYEITKMFLEHGADPNMKAYGFPSIFHTKNPEILQLLLNYGADPNFRDSSGSTKLFSVRRVEVARCLLENGADPDIKNNLNTTAYDNLVYPEQRDVAAFVKSYQEENKNALLIKPAR